ncbi:thiamine diphosphokinase [Kosmotoga pacifica]|uniref:Thiamine diphosphokinase n=1 Tax=Kosmotoga pacifica TaxID=1330330 RepID=A0A0G2Z6G7_9BACT|nr:thiamine diphosphokinase [Kosmotoga pacifica]AKI97190.1 hypothetical protein IX53_04485 [Kosmotoga pacifica]
MKTAAVFLGGKKDSSKKFFRKIVNISDFIVAVDSGAEYLRKIEVVPDLLIGDLDSVSPETLNWCVSNGVETIKFPHEKDETDTELALIELNNRGFNRVILLTATGGREDHFLATLMLLLKFSKEEMEVKILSERVEIGLVHGSKTFSAIPGETWSIFPFGSLVPGVTLKGFKYELENREMAFDQPFGISNTATANEVTIAAEKGKVIYFRWLKEF